MKNQKVKIYVTLLLVTVFISICIFSLLSTDEITNKKVNYKNKNINKVSNKDKKPISSKSFIVFEEENKSKTSSKANELKEWSKKINRQINKNAERENKIIKKLNLDRKKINANDFNEKEDLRKWEKYLEEKQDKADHWSKTLDNVEHFWDVESKYGSRHKEEKDNKEEKCLY